MSIKKYEAFVKTVQMGSLTKAAEMLGSTQSRISHILSDLEEEYGFTLMNRGRGGVKLTEAGALLFPKMEEIVQKSRELDALISDINKADAGTVRLGTFSSVAVHWLPGILQAFQAQHPRVEVRILSGDYHDIDQWINSGDIDVGFVTLPAPKDMNTIQLAKDPLVAIMPEGHRLAEQDAVAIESLRDEHFISLLQSSNHDIHRAMDKAGVRPHIKYSTKDDYAMIAMVQQGLGVSIVPKLLIDGRHEGIVVRPLQPDAYRTIALAMPKQQPLPAVSAFAETTVSWLRENGIAK
ncbi:MAG: LysR family transcriptional regulator [Oscillospiraceae bacterium]|nr:LysR family transcriptional regulator [Oscillospiraceae bacterium]